MFSRSLLRHTKTVLPRRQISRSRPVRGGNGHGHEESHDLHHFHKKLGPYEVPHHPTYPQQAHPFGIDFQKGYKAEGWEVITALVYAGMFGMIFYSTRNEKADDEFKQWAKREAEARLQVIEDGGEVEYGKYYSQHGGDGRVNYEHSEDVGEAPKRAE